LRGRPLEGGYLEDWGDRKKTVRGSQRKKLGQWKEDGTGSGLCLLVGFEISSVLTFGFCCQRGGLFTHTFATFLWDWSVWPLTMSVVHTAYPLLPVEWRMISLECKVQVKFAFRSGFLNLVRAWATFTLSCRLAGHQIINDGNLLISRIWGSHGGEYEDGCLPGCCAV
jgi:hypothetical protein